MNCVLEVLTRVFSWAGTRINPQISVGRKIKITQSQTNILSVLYISLAHCFGKPLTNCQTVVQKSHTEQPTSHIDFKYLDILTYMHRIWALTESVRNMRVITFCPNCLTITSCLEQSQPPKSQILHVAWQLKRSSQPPGPFGSGKATGQKVTVLKQLQPSAKFKNQ